LRRDRTTRYDQRCWPADAYTHANSYIDRHVYSYSDGYRNLYAYGYSYGDSNGNIYSDSNSYGYRNSHSDTLHACGSVSPKRNQCDFQQLCRALEQRKRCDRLSAGRVHKQHFHHLRTRLSEFERRKRDQLLRDRFEC
jgi:hypothetical protein